MGDMLGVCKGADAGATGASSSTSAAASCTGPNCCPKSSCWGPAPVGKCESRRGPTDCTFSLSKPTSAGVCKCKYGACSMDGVCPPTAAVGAQSTSAVTQQSTGGIGLWEVNDEATTDPAELSSRTALATCLGLGLLMVSAAVVFRWRRQSSLQLAEDPD